MSFSQDEILKLRYPNLSDDIKQSFSQVFPFDNSIFSRTLLRAINSYSNFVLSELSCFKKKVREEMKEKRKRLQLLKKYYPNYMDGQEILPCCTSVFEIQSDDVVQKADSCKRKRVVKKKSEEDPNQYSLF